MQPHLGVYPISLEKSRVGIQVWKMNISALIACFFVGLPRFTPSNQAREGLADKVLAEPFTGDTRRRRGRDRSSHQVPWLRERALSYDPTHDMAWLSETCRGTLSLLDA